MRAHIPFFFKQWDGVQKTRSRQGERSKVGQFMEAQKGRTPLGEIERQSADLREASAELRQARHRHSDEALAVLTEGQRARLREAHGAEGARS